MSSRHLAGSRANKHHPLARETRASDTYGSMDLWPAEQVYPPNHAARAVDIRTCKPTLGDALGGRRPTRADAKASTHATPLTAERRVANYQRQNRAKWLTPRQAKRAMHKERRNGGTL
jgi:hypothetical protein